MLASRGSVIPLFLEQIADGGPVTITTPEMTRFLLSLDQAVDTIFAALTEACRGETYIPRVPAARMIDVAAALIGDAAVETVFTGIRPGEKIHEILVSEEEAHRTIARGRLLRHSADSCRSCGRKNWNPCSAPSTARPTT